MKSRVRDVVLAAEHAKQRARLYGRARVFLASKFVGDADPEINFEPLAMVLEELLVAASGAEPEARRLLAQPAGAEPLDALRAVLDHGCVHAPSTPERSQPPGAGRSLKRPR
jgi:hypothetical protein